MRQQGRALVLGSLLGEGCGGAQLGLRWGRRNEVPGLPERPLLRQGPGRRGGASDGGFGVKSKNGGGILRVETDPKAEPLGLPGPAGAVHPSRNQPPLRVFQAMRVRLTPPGTPGHC